MSFLKNIFNKKDEAIKSYEDFWSWFQKNEKEFYTVIKQKNNIEQNFFNKLSPKLNELKEGIFYLTGMVNQDTVELILTPDGIIKNIVFVEELIKSAPEINHWLFTALKPPAEIKNIQINMAGHSFSKDNMHFCFKQDNNFPDEIDITIIHNDYNEENKSTITNGIYIFLDNFLGELNFITSIDNLKIAGKEGAEEQIIPIEKLKEFLNWREKEFIEKYEGIRHNTDNDNYSILEAELQNGTALIAVVNTDLLEWDSKASHPWILSVEIKYSGENNNGMPDQPTSELLNEIENKILENLRDLDGYLNVGRETANSTREIYFACKDFRKPSSVLHQIQLKYANKIAINYDIYKDKYWKSFDRFINN
ncbi:MAG: DUF695 domain-containing protein [Parafilimonas sp.]